jgi:SAM-dependent methyltransferase
VKLLEAAKRFYIRSHVLGTYYPDFRDAWLAHTRIDGKPDRVLDAGCGGGEIHGEYKRFKVPVDYYGVDLAVGNASEFRVSAVADLHKLPFKDESFDKIICNQVLEHVNDPQAVLRQFFRVLRPGGSLHIAVPFLWHLHQEPYDRFRFSLNGLQYVLSEAGLQPQSIVPMGGFFMVLRYVLTSWGLVTESWPRPFSSLARPFVNLFVRLEAIFGAPLFYLLDQLDRNRKLTLGYFVHATRPGVNDKRMPEDPYACPSCAGHGGGAFRKGADLWTCQTCGTKFELKSGVPFLAAPECYQPVTEKISQL